MNLVNPVAKLREHRRLAAERRAADAELVKTVLPPPRLAWRTRELVCDESRAELAATLVDIVHGAQLRYMPGPTPLNRRAAREERDLLLTLAARLEQRDAAVHPRGVILLRRLLEDGAGPLYAQEREDELHRRLEATLRALQDGK